MLLEGFLDGPHAFGGVLDGPPHAKRGNACEATEAKSQCCMFFWDPDESFRIIPRQKSLVKWLSQTKASGQPQIEESGEAIDPDINVRTIPH